LCGGHIEELGLQDFPPETELAQRLLLLALFAPADQRPPGERHPSDEHNDGNSERLWGKHTGIFRVEDLT
jgi:hypothetical protein